MMQFVEFAGPRGTLRGMLHLPGTGQGRYPGVVLCHGMTGQRMESTFLFVALARALEAAGIASLRFDFYGSGESDGDFSEVTVSGEVADARAALALLRSRPQLDPDRVGLMGISLGGMVTALVLGSDAGPQVRAAALWSAAANTLRRRLDRMTEDQKGDLERGGWVNLNGLRLSNAFFLDLEKQDPRASIARYAGPVLVVHGTADEAVPLAEGEGYLTALATRPGGLSEKLIVEGGTHTFNNWDHRQAVCERTVRWFRDHL